MRDTNFHKEYPVGSLSDADSSLELLLGLSFKGMLDPMTSIPMETDGTCHWIFDDLKFRTWESRDELHQHRGVLLIKGHPGTGKSTLMRQAFRRTQNNNPHPMALTAAFFCSNRSPETLHRTATGFYRCVLHQLLLQDQRVLHKVARRLIGRFSDDVFRWSEAEFRDMFREVLEELGSRPIFIFIDGLDECEVDDLFEIKNFIFQSSNSAFQANGCLNFCVSTRHYGQINIPGAFVIAAEDGNRNDIIHHITTACQEEPALEPVQEILLEKAQGIFLWVVLVVALLKKNCRGRSAKFLRELVDELPPKLEDLYFKLLQAVKPEDATQTKFLMYVLLFGYESWNLRCIHTGLCFVVNHFRSIQEWEESSDFLETAEKRHEQVLKVSLGLVQAMIPSEQSDVVSSEYCPENHTTYQFIHGTVRDFFRNGRGFESLNGRTEPVEMEEEGHLALTTALTRYLGTLEIRDWIREDREGDIEEGDIERSESFWGRFGHLGHSTCDVPVNLMNVQEHDPFFDLAVRQVVPHLTTSSFYDLSHHRRLVLVGSTGIEVLDFLQSTRDLEFPYSLYTIPKWIAEANPRHYIRRHWGWGTSLDDRQDMESMRRFHHRPRSPRRQTSMDVDTGSE